MTRTIDRIIVHCSATLPDPSIDVRDIRRMHLDRGWRDIGYHWIITADGHIQKGRDLDRDGDVMEEVGAHALGYNATSLGICLIGGVNEQGRSTPNYSSDQLKALRMLLGHITEDLLSATIVGHGDLPGTKKDCPCFAVVHWLVTGEVVPVRGAK